MGRYNEMLTKTDPPEPSCPRCKDYVQDEDLLHCPTCYTNLRLNWITDEVYFCINCSDAKVFKVDELVWKCSKCGYDGKPIKCCGCGKFLRPDNRMGLCDTCQLQEQLDQEEHYEELMQLPLEELEERRMFE